MRHIEDYPLTLKTPEMMEILRCSREKFYEYARSKGFPRIKGCRIIKSPRDAFFKWLNETSLVDQEHSQSA